MAGLLTVLVIGAADGIDKYKTKRKAKKAALETATKQQEQEAYFHSSKAKEAFEDRRRAEEEEGRASESSMHPALRGEPVEAPPPYVREMEGYYAPRAQAETRAVTEDRGTVEAPRFGESEGARRRRTREEYFRRSGYYEAHSVEEPAR